MSSENPQGIPPVEPGKPKGPPDGELTKEVKQMAMLCHLLGALLSVIGAVILWLIKKDDHPFIDDQGKEATNFQLTLFIAHVVGTMLICVYVGMLIIFAAWVCQVVFGIIGAIKANDGEYYRYPFAIRLIK